jgi:hypothetical protein
MAIELKTFLLIFFNNIKHTNKNKTKDKQLYYYEISSQKDLITEIFKAIENELLYDDKYNFIDFFGNKNNYIDQTEINDYLLDNIQIINNFSIHSKEIIRNYLEIVLSDKFERDNNIIRTLLYYKRISNEIFIRWKRNYSYYLDDITDFNRYCNIISKFNIYLLEHNITDMFDICSDLNTMSIIFYDTHNNIKLIFYDFFEQLIIKYNIQDLIKNIQNKISNKKTESPKIKKKYIRSTIKRLVWNTNIGESEGKSKCLCCKLTEISQMSFHCGHIIAESNGGETIVSNLKPICQNCNSSMGPINMDEFMKSLK